MGSFTTSTRSYRVAIVDLFDLHMVSPATYESTGCRALIDKDASATQGLKSFSSTKTEGYIFDLE